MVRLATIKFEGTECPLKGVQGVTGSITFLALTLQDSRTVQQINFTNEEPGSLKLGSSAVEVNLTILERLASGLPFSFL